MENPKIKELLKVIEEAGDQPILIWAHFHWEIIKICHELYQKYGENSVVTLYSGTKDRDHSIKAFQENKAKFLVAHPASAAYGLTLINCSLQIFFSLDFSWEKFDQARARIHRANQTKNCTYIYLIAKNTIDEKILSVLRKKGDAQEIIHDLMKKHRNSSFLKETNKV